MRQLAGRREFKFGGILGSPVLYVINFCCGQK